MSDEFGSWIVIEGGTVSFPCVAMASRTLWGLTCPLLRINDTRIVSTVTELKVQTAVVLMFFNPVTVTVS
jgi:hypothetical protein